MSSGNPLNQKQLEDAFLVFNQVSEQLVDSYHELQGRVHQLNAELAIARNERMRQLAEKESLANRLSQLLDALPAAVVVLDGSGLIQQFNSAAEHLFNRIELGRPWSDLYLENFQHDQVGKEQFLQTGRLLSLTERDLNPETGKILLLLDITETRDLQERLSRRKRLSAMGEMAAQLAHQIRTPLSSALLYTSHLSNYDLSQEKRKHFCECIRGGLQLMERQISDMLAFARGGQYSPELFGLSPLLEEMAQILEPALNKADVRFNLVDHTSGHCMLSGNRDALQGALMNIATNSMQHGGTGISLNVELMQSGHQSVKLLISDNGPGVPGEIQDQIFDPFFTTGSSGTGLGLAVVQSVVLGHNGSISLLTDYSDGACFQIELPITEKSDNDWPEINPSDHCTLNSISGRTYI